MGVAASSARLWRRPPHAYLSTSEWYSLTPSTTLYTGSANLRLFPRTTQWVRRATAAADSHARCRPFSFLMKAKAATKAQNPKRHAGETPTLMENA